MRHRLPLGSDDNQVVIQPGRPTTQVENHEPREGVPQTRGCGSNFQMGLSIVPDLTPLEAVPGHPEMKAP